MVGDNNEFYSLSDSSSRKIYKDKSGIYGLYYEEECFYIGQSKNLYSRLSSHNRPETRLREIKNKIQREASSDRAPNREKSIKMYEFIRDNSSLIKFKILKLSTEKNLDKYEEEFISLYKPKYNYVGVDVDYWAHSNNKK